MYCKVQYIVALWLSVWSVIYAQEKGSIIGKKCEYILKQKSFYFTSPGYPEYYPNNARCRWKIVAGTGYYIKLTVIEVDIEDSKHCKFDLITIYDGEGETAIPIRQLCGTRLPEVTQSVGNVLTIVMETDGVSNGRGFQMKYEIIPACSIITRDMSGSVESPGYPFGYPDGIHCTYHFPTIEENKYLHLYFEDFELEDVQSYECFDHLTLLTRAKDGEETLQGQFCGTSLRKKGLCFNTTTFTMKFVTDKMWNLNGFKMSYMISDDKCSEDEDIKNYKDLEGEAVRLEDIQLLKQLLEIGVDGKKITTNNMASPSSQVSFIKESSSLAYPRKAPVTSSDNGYSSDFKTSLKAKSYTETVQPALSSSWNLDLKLSSSLTIEMLQFTAPIAPENSIQQLYSRYVVAEDSLASVDIGFTSSSSDTSRPKWVSVQMGSEQFASNIQKYSSLKALGVTVKGSQKIETDTVIKTLPSRTIGRESQMRSEKISDTKFKSTFQPQLVKISSLSLLSPYMQSQDGLNESPIVTTPSLSDSETDSVKTIFESSVDKKSGASSLPLKHPDSSVIYGEVFTEFKPPTSKTTFKSTVQRSIRTPYSSRIDSRSHRLEELPTFSTTSSDSIRISEKINSLVNTVLSKMLIDQSIVRNVSSSLLFFTNPELSTNHFATPNYSVPIRSNSLNDMNALPSYSSYLPTQSFSMKLMLHTVFNKNITERFSTESSLLSDPSKYDLPRSLLSNTTKHDPSVIQVAVSTASVPYHSSNQDSSINRLVVSPSTKFLSSTSNQDSSKNRLAESPKSFSSHSSNQDSSINTLAVSPTTRLQMHSTNQDSSINSVAVSTITGPSSHSSNQGSSINGMVVSPTKSLLSHSSNQDSSINSLALSPASLPLSSSNQDLSISRITIPATDLLSNQDSSISINHLTASTISLLLHSSYQDSSINSMVASPKLISRSFSTSSKTISFSYKRSSVSKMEISSFETSKTFETKPTKKLLISSAIRTSPFRETRPSESLFQTNGTQKAKKLTAKLASSSSPSLPKTVIDSTSIISSSSKPLTSLPVSSIQPQKDDKNQKKCAKYKTIQMLGGKLPIVGLMSNEKHIIQQVLKATINSAFEVAWPNEGFMGDVGLMNYGTLLSVDEYKFILRIQNTRIILIQIREEIIEKFQMEKLMKLPINSVITLGSYMSKIPSPITMSVLVC